MINISYYGGELPEQQSVWKGKFPKALDGQSISTGCQRYTFIERLLIGDEKATFTQTALDIVICTIDNFIKIPMKMTKHVFQTYVFCKQKGTYICIYINPGA